MPHVDVDGGGEANAEEPPEHLRAGGRHRRDVDAQNEVEIASLRERLRACRRPGLSRQYTRTPSCRAQTEAQALTRGAELRACCSSAHPEDPHFSALREHVADLHVLQLLRCSSCGRKRGRYGI